MVRLIEVKRRGKTVWAEVAPEACPAGHRGELVPTYGGCPTAECGLPTRYWRCRADGCGDVAIDDEHVHRSGGGTSR
ncbi:hypothetical protein [Actinoplanes sp. NPDC049118]|uniref:hypothetical protein n=1 Tax=Actinoplanes sp. NPDC049118 TaxID=3155769 RepID=UPI0033FE2661